ncbi:retrovirus-related pol polyprotein from transposon TNT 1-94 [Tanacetum coccineum]
MVPFIPMTTGQRKPERQLTRDDIKAANLDQRLKVNTNHVKDSELASLFGKLKYEENLIDSIYETEKNKSLVSATPLLTSFISTSIIQDFQDCLDDEMDTRSSHEYLNDLEEEYQARALSAKSKRFFKKGTQRFSSAKQLTKLNATNVARKIILQEIHKLELRPTKDFEAKYNKVKAKLALLSLSASASKAATVKNKGLIVEAYEWDEEEVSSNHNEMVEVKVLMALAEENDVVSKEGARNCEWVNISMRKYISEQIPSLKKKRILGVNQLMEDPSSSGQKDLVFLILLTESQRNTIDPSVAVTESSTTEYDLADESSVCSTPLPPLKKLDGAKPISGPKTIKSILRSKSTFKAKTLKGVTINEPSSAPVKGNKSSSALKVYSDPAGKLKSVKIKDDPPLAIVMKELNILKLQISKNRSSYSRINQPQQDHFSRRGVKPRNPQHVMKSCKTCGSTVHTTTDHNDIELFRRGEELQAKKAEALKSSKAESSNANRYKTQTRNGCSRHMTGVKSYLQKYVEQPGPKVVFGIDSTCTTESYGSIKCNESCFFAKASENLNWLWHKGLAHLNFKKINKLAKQNLVIGLPSLVYSKDKPCSSCEKGKHHRDIFKTKQTSYIKKCIHLLHMDLFGPVTPRSINHEKYTLVIVDEYSRYTWVYFLKKKSQAPETIMSFIRRVENQNDIKVKQLRTDNGTKFKNSILVNFCDEKRDFS